MNKINLPELTIAQIMQHIRAEAPTPKPPLSETPASVLPALNTDFTQVNRYPKEKSFKIKKIYSIADFCQYHDKDFIRYLFLALLQREPDEDGMDYYLSQLRSGKRTKRELIATMRFSKEGRAQKVVVKGIKLPFLVALLYRLPIVGYFLKLLVALLKLPTLVEKVHQLEALTQAPKPELAELEYTLQELLNQKANRAELDWKVNRTELELKANRQELDLKADRAELAAKANRDEVNSRVDWTSFEKFAQQIEQSLADKQTQLIDNQAKIDLKADRAELALKANRDELDSKAHRDEVNIRVDWASFEGYAKQVDETFAAKQTQLDQLLAAKQIELTHVLTAKQQQLDALNQQLIEVNRQIRDHKTTLLDNQRRLQLVLEEARKRLPKPFSPQQLKNITQEEEHLHDAMYIAFEDKFRGTRADIKQRQQVYLPYIETALAETHHAPILDVGCGRGEWLELLQEHGIQASCLDLNTVMIHECHQRGLDAQEKEVIAHLRTLPANSLAAITGFHIIEHLPFKLLLTLLDECLRVLKPGGKVIFETPNPENLLVGAYLFYTDPTHLNPLVPETTRFLLEQRGFIQVEIKRLHKYGDYYPVISEDPFLLQHVYNELDFGVIGCKA